MSKERGKPTEDSIEALKEMFQQSSNERRWKRYQQAQYCKLGLQLVLES